MDAPIIPLDIVTGDYYENVNPHHICDGKWGGWGPSYWWHAKEYGFTSWDVIEWRHVEGKQQWHRVWIDKAKTWRDLTAEEVARLPVFGERRRIAFDKVISFPLNKKAAKAVAAVMKQPLLQVLEQAPILAEVFSKIPLDNPTQSV